MDDRRKLQDQRVIIKEKDKELEKVKSKMMKLEQQILDERDSATRERINLAQYKERKAEREAQFKQGSPYLQEQERQKLLTKEAAHGALDGMKKALDLDEETGTIKEIYNTLLHPLLEQLTFHNEELKKVIIPPPTEFDLRQKLITKGLELRALDATALETDMKRKSAAVDRSPDPLRKSQAATPIAQTPLPHHFTNPGNNTLTNPQTSIFVTHPPRNVQQVSKYLRLTNTDGQGIPTGFYGINSKDIDTKINSKTVNIYTSELQEFVESLEQQNGSSFTTEDHKTIKQAIISSWQKGFSILEKSNISRPSTLHIQQMDALNKLSNRQNHIRKHGNCLPNDKRNSRLLRRS